jgi:NAD(P)-dependent dehydrogenase (short-subunit alcohol dehydrogenase family)
MKPCNYLIIGASSGIGKELAHQLAQKGHYIYATFNKNKVKKTTDQIEYHSFNVLDETINLDFIPDRLDGLVYCPGSINLRPFTRFKPKEFMEDFQFEVVGAIKVIQSALPKLKASGDASIVLFSTIAVKVGFNFHTLVSASKGAIEGLTKSLAAELAPHIRVNCIAPSITDTPLASSLLNTDVKRDANAKRHPLKKIGSVEDIANTATFLLSKQNSWITGQILHVDGGLSSLRV